MNQNNNVRLNSIVPFLLLIIGNLICIVLFATGNIRNIEELVQLIWIVILDVGVAALLIVYEIYPRVPIGTKSLLFGAHQFLWHPLTVFLAWHELYGWPNWKETICIFIHDWGYWEYLNMEGEEGINHPYYGAKLAQRLLDTRRWVQSQLYGDSKLDWGNGYWETRGNFYYCLCLFHSRTIASIYKMKPSKLCWADKLSVKYDPWWLYLPRVILSGEIHEYRAMAHKAVLISEAASNREWYEWACKRMIRKAYAQDARPLYQEGS